MGLGDKIARGVSVVLSNPIVGMAFGYALGLSETESMWGAPDQAAAVLAALFVGVFPYLGAVIYYVMGKSDIFVSNREQRPALIVTSLPMTIVGTLYFYIRGLHLVSVVLALMLVETLIFLMITFKWKISLHVSGLTFPLTIVWIRNGVSALAGFLLLPVLMWARVRMGAHSWEQVIVSALVSLTMTYCGFRTLIPVV